MGVLTVSALPCTALAQKLIDAPGPGYREQANKVELKPYEGPWLFRQSDEEHFTGVRRHQTHRHDQNGPAFSPPASRIRNAILQRVDEADGAQPGVASAPAPYARETEGAVSLSLG